VGSVGIVLRTELPLHRRLLVIAKLIFYKENINA
jgi:hypothetical protein